MSNRIIALTLSALVTIWLGGCATPVAKYDYTAFRKAAPKSILILPPINQSPDIQASNGILATATFPVAEDGFYVFPVAMVAQTFKENGVTSPDEIQQLPIAKLREVFGADAALYITVKSYGASYQVVASNVQVTLEAKLVDLRTGDLLWQGKASASNQEGRSNQGGLIGMLVVALVEQVINSSVADPSYGVGAIANNRLLRARPDTNGMMYGPRSPDYQKQ
jgi:hypothetical protein